MVLVGIRESVIDRTVDAGDTCLGCIGYTLVGSSLIVEVVVESYCC